MRSKSKNEWLRLKTSIRMQMWLDLVIKIRKKSILFSKIRKSKILSITQSKTLRATGVTSTFRPTLWYIATVKTPKWTSRILYIMHSVGIQFSVASNQLQEHLTFLDRWWNVFSSSLQSVWELSMQIWSFWILYNGQVGVHWASCQIKQSIWYPRREKKTVSIFKFS